MMKKFCVTATVLGDYTATDAVELRLEEVLKPLLAGLRINLDEAEVRISFFESGESARDVGEKVKDKVDLIASIFERLTYVETEDGQSTFTSQQSYSLSIVPSSTIKIFIVEVEGERFAMSVPVDSATGLPQNFK